MINIGIDFTVIVFSFSVKLVYLSLNVWGNNHKNMNLYMKYFMYDFMVQKAQSKNKKVRSFLNKSNYV